MHYSGQYSGKMARTKNKSVSNRRLSGLNMSSYIKQYANAVFLRKLVFDPNYLYVTCWTLLIFEFILNIFIIQKIRYTEIDWIAYMQEVEGFLNGTLDYNELGGDTGPLVYPAGFVYIYSALYYITSHGQDVRLAQYIFLMLYIIQLYVSFKIYCKTRKVPPYAIVLSTLTSYRIHSIFVLRLFNDPIAVLLFYISLNLFLSNKWIAGSIFYSLAVSVKMNILLYAPCLLILYLTNLNYTETLLNLCVCGLVQLFLGLPFLYGNFWSYICSSFNLGRVFEHKWTVNYRFLDRTLFENQYFHLGLLALHISLLFVFLPPIVKYLRSYAILTRVIGDLKEQTNKTHKRKKLHENEDKKAKLLGEQKKLSDSFERQPKQGDLRQRNVNTQPVPSKELAKEDEINFSKTAQLLVLPFFVTNLIGIACARSLHYQFYSWYFHSLLYLIHCTPYRKPMMFLILAVVEFCWNSYPSTVLSSSLLHGCHILLLYGVYRNMKQ